MLDNQYMRFSCTNSKINVHIYTQYNSNIKILFYKYKKNNSYLLAISFLVFEFGNSSSNDATIQSVVAFANDDTK